MRVINNLLRAGKGMETTQIATGWTKEQIVRVVQPLMEKSSMLGLMELPYQQQSIDLAPGDTLFLYTDGVSEAMDEEKRLFTEPRIRDTLNALPPEQDVAGILSAVLEAVRRHAGNAEQSDDITMLGLRYLPRG